MQRRKRRRKKSDPQEMITAYDRHMEPLGDYPRSYVHYNAFWHRVVQCWIIGVSQEGVRVYLQRRSYEKRSNPGKYDITAGGHVMAGEENRIAMARELREETGIIVSPESFLEVGQYPEISGRDREMASIYVSIQGDPPFRPGPEVTYMVSADLEDFYCLCEGKVSDIPVTPAIRTGPLIHESFRVGSNDICYHPGFAAKVYPFIKEYVRSFFEKKVGTS